MLPFNAFPPLLIIKDSRKRTRQAIWSSRACVRPIAVQKAKTVWLHKERAVFIQFAGRSCWSLGSRLAHPVKTAIPSRFVGLANFPGTVHVPDNTRSAEQVFQ
jgi:hypothetical protein